MQITPHVHILHHNLMLIPARAGDTPPVAVNRQYNSIQLTRTGAALSCASGEVADIQQNQ